MSSTNMGSLHPVPFSYKPRLQCPGLTCAAFTPSLSLTSLDINVPHSHVQPSPRPFLLQAWTSMSSTYMCSLHLLSVSLFQLLHFLLLLLTHLLPQLPAHVDGLCTPQQHSTLIFLSYCSTYGIHLDMAGNKSQVIWQKMLKSHWTESTDVRMLL